jgi:hypothetical protein
MCSDGNTEDKTSVMIAVGMNTDTGLSLRGEKGDKGLEIDQDQDQEIEEEDETVEIKIYIFFF